MHYLVGQPGKPVRHWVERHRIPLVSAEEMLRSFRKAGFRAGAILSEPYRDRGLYLGVRPTPARASSRSERGARKGHPSGTMDDAESPVVAEKRHSGAASGARKPD